jgi:porin
MVNGRPNLRGFGDAVARLAPPVLALLIALGAAAVAAEPPLDLSAANVTDVLADVSGGLRREARILDKLDITAAYVGDNHNHPGLSAFIDLQATNGANFSKTVIGDAQIASNLDAPAGVRVLDAWIARDFGGEGGFKTGILDLNSEFDVQATGVLFLNSSHGIGPDFSQSGENGPSIFPNTGLGFAGWWLPGDHWQLKAGVFEGTAGDPAHPGRTSLSVSNNEGALLVFEARNRIMPGVVIGAGTWRYTARFDALDGPGRVSGNSGIYGIIDGSLYSAPEGGRSGLSGWLRAGFADNRINPIGATLGGGLVYTGPFGRNADQAGIAFGYVHFGSPARHAASGAGTPMGPSETTAEATYSFAVGESLTVQPDIQYVFSPGADPMLADALIVGSRVTATW